MAPSLNTKALAQSNSIVFIIILIASPTVAHQTISGNPYFVAFVVSALVARRRHRFQLLLFLSLSSHLLCTASLCCFLVVIVLLYSSLIMLPPHMLKSYM